MVDSTVLENYLTQIIRIDVLKSFIIGDYEIKSKMDKGAFGIVYSAINTKTLKRVIVKFISDHESFVQESEAINDINKSLPAST